MGINNVKHALSKDILFVACSVQMMRGSICVPKVYKTILGNVTSVVKAALPLKFRIHPVCVTKVVQRRVVATAFGRVVRRCHSAVPLAHLVRCISSFLQLSCCRYVSPDAPFTHGSRLRYYMLGKRPVWNDAHEGAHLVNVLSVARLFCRRPSSGSPLPDGPTRSLITYVRPSKVVDNNKKYEAFSFWTSLLPARRSREHQQKVRS